ncbi:MAG TPA: TraR/DksA C4-type zinc finger protein [Planctomycetota bacterium]|nr:TraR/DksA C4-type zinc finger protein [Planctomycetota bacterium]
MTTRPVAEGPSQTELQHFKEELWTRRVSLLEAVRSLEDEETSSGGTVSGLSIHSADLGTDRASHDVSLGCRESAIDEIQEIDEALRRIDEGTFGICGTCGCGISMKRLKAIPYTNLCLLCKKAEETR